MSDEDEGGQLIEGVFDGPMIAVTNHAPMCRHSKLYVDAESRAVSCRGCSAHLDAFSVLLDFANKERHARHWDRERLDTQKRLHELKAEEKRVKARLRNAKKQLTLAERARGRS